MATAPPAAAELKTPAFVSEAFDTSNSGFAGQGETDKSELLWIFTIGAMVVIQLWFGMIATSLWQDETGTWWIVKDGVAEAVRRSFFWSGQSPLFYLVAWSSSRLFGLNEIALRLPSVLAMSGAIYFVYRIAERLYNRASAALVAFVFLCLVSFYAVDARPYALAIFCIAVSIWALLRWLDRNRLPDAVLYVVAATSVVYAHCIMSLSLIAGVLYAVAATRKEPRRWAWLGLQHVAIVLLCLPLFPELKTFYADRSLHNNANLPGVGDLLFGFIPGSLAGALIILVWIWMTFRGDAEIAGKCTRLAALLIGTWALFAPLFLFLLPLCTNMRLYVDRYFSSALPGQALLAGGLLSSIRPRIVRKALLLIVGALTIVAQGRLTVKSHGNEDWRSAMTAAANEAGPAPVLMVSGFIEGADFATLRNPKLREILFAPELFYGEPERSIRLPNIFDGRGNSDLEKIAGELEKEPRFFLLTASVARNYESWLAGRLGSRCSLGSGPADERSFGHIRLEQFTCGNQHVLPTPSARHGS